MDGLVKEGVSPEDAWNRNSIQLTQAAEVIFKYFFHLFLHFQSIISSQAHCRAFIVDTFVNQIDILKVSEPLLKVLRELCELYSIYWLLNNLGDFLMVKLINFSLKLSSSKNNFFN